MNIQELELWRELKKPNIYFHKKAEEELRELMKESDCETKLFRLLVLRIDQLSILKEQVFQIKEFEILKKSNGLCCMHLKVKNSNIRILFSRSEKGEFILHAFFKRAGKKQTDYEKHIPIAIARMTEMEELK